MTWAYLPVLNKLLQFEATILLGYTSSALGFISAEKFVPQAVEVVFKILLPSLIIKGLGTIIDFYTDKNVWMFISAFLILRAMALCIAFLAVLFSNWIERRPANGLGYIAVLWLSLSWISTVILGVPICTAMFGRPTLGVKYGVAAAISSWIFQLPLQLVFFEYHTAEKEQLPQLNNAKQVVLVATPQIDPIATPNTTSDEGSSIQLNIISDESEISGPPEKEISHINKSTSWWSIVKFDNLSHQQFWIDIARRLAHNPVLIALILGFIISLSTAGKYLRCPSSTCIPGLEWIGATLGWLGDCVSPLSLFAMGAWMHSVKNLVKLPKLKICLFMLSKLIVIPLIMVGLSNLMEFDNEAGRAAVLIASLPISMASFSLAHQYKIGEIDLATNVTVGTILMLPAVIVWNLVMDAVGLYPIST